MGITLGLSIMATKESKLEICHISDEIVKAAKKVRFIKGDHSCCLVMKIDKNTREVVVDEIIEDTPWEEIVEELPERSPRFLAYSFPHTHTDQRKTYPYIFIFCSPTGCKPELQMMYSSTRNPLVNMLEIGKQIDVRSVEEMTKEWLFETLGLKL